MKFITTLLAILFVASTALADQRIVGHMTPLDSERLANPVTLDCGVTLQEIRGGHPDIAKLNALCTHAMSNFFAFVQHKGLKVSRKDKFNWDASLLPIDNRYRSLNDETYRFRNRFVKGNIIGYTDYDTRYMFSMVNANHREFNTTFVHELFHSMSMYYGVYDNHPGPLSAKTNADEVLAQDFTEALGYGR